MNIWGIALLIIIVGGLGAIGWFLGSMAGSPWGIVGALVGLVTGAIIVLLFDRRSR